jgi:predicted RNA methylase
MLATLRCLRWPLKHVIWSGGPSHTPAAQTLRDDFDERCGVDTARTSEISDLAAIQSQNYKHGFQHQTVEADTAVSLLRSLAIRYEDFMFLDMGSGKGKMLLVASSFPFRKVVGVEYCEPLHAIAERNIKVYKNPAQKCFDVQSMYTDAALFSIPADPLVIFMYNPFDGVLMRKVLHRLVESLETHPRRILILYYNPVYAQVFSGTAFVPRVRSDGYILFENDSKTGDGGSS